MKFQRFKYDVKASIELTGEDLYILHVCSSTHYDGVCQSMSKQGGFIYGCINWLQMGVVGLDNIKPANVAFTSGVSKKKKPIEKMLAAKGNFEASGRELDTLCKCLETANYLAGTGELLEGKAGTIYALQNGLRDAFRKVCEESQRIND